MECDHFRLRKWERFHGRIHEVRVKRCGKSAPGPWQHGFYDVNSIPEQRRGGTMGLPDRPEEAA